MELQGGNMKKRSISTIFYMKNKVKFAQNKINIHNKED